MLSEREELGYFTQQQVAAFAGVNQRTVRKWDGLTPYGVNEGGETVYRGTDVKAFWEKVTFERGRLEGQEDTAAYDDDGAEINEHVERKKKLKEERIGQEIKNAKALGELAPIDLMISVLGDSINAMNSHLEGIPSIIRRHHPDLPGAVLDQIESTISTVRNRIADGKIQYTDPRLQEFNQEPEYLHEE